MTDTTDTIELDPVAAQPADAQIDEESAARQLARLASRVDTQDAALLEKDEIIGALTERLEQAAERLDRVKRSGADRGPRGVPTELIAHSDAVKQSVETIAAQFDGIDLGNSFHRLEMLLTEVRELVIERPAVEQAGMERSTAERPAELFSKPAEDSKGPSEASGVDSGDWDAIKRQLLGEPAAECEPGTTAESEEFVEEVVDVDEAAVPRATMLADEPATPLPDGLPEPLDFETADRDELIEALESRDRYITALTRRLSEHHARHTVPTDWDSLASAPADLTLAVQQLHDELSDAVRTAEVDLCLERARLSRERTKLDQMQDAIDARQARPAVEGTAEAPEPSQRWRRVLGLNND